MRDTLSSPAVEEGSVALHNNRSAVYKTSHGCMEFFRTCCSARAVYTEEGGKFDSFSPFNQGAKRKCGPRLHWLDKRVTTSAVYFVRNRTPFLFAAAGRQSNEEKIAIMVKRLSPPSPLNFNFSKPSSTKGMKYKMKSWEIKKKLSAPKNRTDT